MSISCRRVATTPTSLDATDGERDGAIRSLFCNLEDDETTQRSEIERSMLSLFSPKKIEYRRNEIFTGFGSVGDLQQSEYESRSQIVREMSSEYSEITVQHKSVILVQQRLPQRSEELNSLSQKAKEQLVTARLNLGLAKTEFDIAQENLRSICHDLGIDELENIEDILRIAGKVEATSKTEYDDSCVALNELQVKYSELNSELENIEERLFEMHADIVRSEELKDFARDKLIKRLSQANTALDEALAKASHSCIKAATASDLCVAMQQKTLAITIANEKFAEQISSAKVEYEDFQSNLKAKKAALEQVEVEKVGFEIERDKLGTQIDGHNTLMCDKLKNWQAFGEKIEQLERVKLTYATLQSKEKEFETANTRFKKIDAVCVDHAAIMGDDSGRRRGYILTSQTNDGVKLKSTHKSIGREIIKWKNICSEFTEKTQAAFQAVVASAENSSSGSPRTVEAVDENLEHLTGDRFLATTVTTTVVCPVIELDNVFEQIVTVQTSLYLKRLYASSLESGSERKHWQEQAEHELNGFIDRISLKYDEWSGMAAASSGNSLLIKLDKIVSAAYAEWMAEVEKLKLMDNAVTTLDGDDISQDPMAIWKSKIENLTEGIILIIKNKSKIDILKEGKNPREAMLVIKSRDEVKRLKKEKSLTKAILVIKDAAEKTFQEILPKVDSARNSLNLFMQNNGFSPDQIKYVNERLDGVSESDDESIEFSGAQIVLLKPELEKAEEIIRACDDVEMELIKVRRIYDKITKAIEDFVDTD